MKSRGVDLDTRMGCAELVRRLGQMGKLRLDDTKTFEKNGIKYFHVREMSVFESLEEKLSLTKAERQKRAAAVADAIEPILLKSRQPQLVQNIRDRIAHTSGFRGKDLARDYAPVSAGRPVRPLEGGQVVARNRGKALRLLGVPAETVKADKAVLRSSTGGKLVTQDWLKADSEKKSMEPPGYAGWNSALLKQESWSNPRHSKVFEMELKHAAAAKVAVVWEADTHRPHPAGELHDWILQAIGTASGSVVIEPQPDQYQADSQQGTKPVYTDEGLKAQIRAAMTKIADAKRAGHDLVITFATPDPGLQQALGKALDLLAKSG